MLGPGRLGTVTICGTRSKGEGRRSSWGERIDESGSNGDAFSNGDCVLTGENEFGKSAAKKIEQL